jgi:hypothetical protein
VNASIGSDARFFCYGIRDNKLNGSWINPLAKYIQMTGNNAQRGVILQAGVWKLEWKVDNNTDDLRLLNGNEEEVWSLVGPGMGTNKRGEMGSLAEIRFETDNICARSVQGTNKWDCLFGQGSGNPVSITKADSNTNYLVLDPSGVLYIDHGQGFRTFLYGSLKFVDTPSNVNNSNPSNAPSGAAGVGGLGSDRRLKDEITLIGKHRGYNVYRWVWNDIATSTYGYRGSEIGFLADELEPKYIGTDTYGYKYLKDGTQVVKYLKELRGGM